MATCHNKNTVEYKALLAEYNSPLIADGIITDWQLINRNDSTPSLSEARDMINDQKMLASAQSKRYGELILKNLAAKGFVSKIGNEYYIVENSKSFVKARNSAKLIRNFLKWSGFAQDSVVFRKTKNKGMYRAVINEQNLDLYKKFKVNGSNSTLPILDHLVKMFPDTKYLIVDELEAKSLYDIIPANRKKSEKWEDVNSFFYGETAVLIKGRVNQTTAIEEVLHPFVDSVQLDNEELFNKLHSEAEKNFPELKNKIDKDYNSVIYSDTERKLELVTQALSNHFNEEFETKPQIGFLRAVKEFLDWFSDIIKSLYSALTGKKLSIKSLNSNMTLTDVSRMLNTKDLTFELNPTIKNLDVRYSLNKETKDTLMNLKKNSATGVQSQIIDQLFHQATKSEFSFEGLTTSRIAIVPDGSGTLLNVDTGKELEYTEDLIMGLSKNPFRGSKYPFKDETEKFLNKIVLGVPFSKSGITDLKLKPIYEHMLTRLDGMRDDRSVFIPNVIISDDVKGVASVIDLLKVDPYGNLQIINFENGKTSYKGKGYSTSKFQLGADSFLKKEGLSEVTPKMENSVTQAVSKRMLENLGFAVETGALTIHIRNNKVEGTTLHPLSENDYYVDKFIPLDIAEENQVIIDEILGQMRNPEEVTDWEDDIYSEEGINFNENIPLYDSLLTGLQNFRLGLISEEESKKNTSNVLSMSKDKVQRLRQISMTRSIIENVALDPDQIDTVHLNIVKESIDQIDEFLEYIGDRDNFSNPDYISKALGWQKFVENYRGLVNLTATAGLSQTHLTYITKLQAKLNQIVGITKGDGTVVTKGAITLAINNFVRDTIKQKSNYNWSEEQLDEIMTQAKDIGYVEYQSGDMATSRDTILALMDKIYKRDRQIVMDRVESRAPRIKRAALKLSNLTSGNRIDYSFLYETDSNGNPTGEYVKRIGKQFKQKQKELYKPLLDDKGGWKNFIDIEDLDEATPEAIKYNKDLAIAREKYFAFKRAENFTDNGPVHGEYFKYTDEFIRARSRFELFVPNANGGGFWTAKSSASDNAYARYRAKYYNQYGPEDNIQKPVLDMNDNPTGQIFKIDYASYVKPEYKEQRSETSRGVDMTSEKWKKLQKPKTELEKAQSEYYNMFIDVFENELLNKLPENIMMIGKLPRIMGGPVDSIKDKPSVVGSLFARMQTKVVNWFSPTTVVKKVFTDEFGDIITDSLPLMYTGSLLEQETLQKAHDDLKELQDKYSEVKSDAEQRKLKRAISDARGYIKKLEAKPSATNLNLDITESLLKFSAMAENYEVMSQSEDTFAAMIEVISNRSYTDWRGNVKKLDGDDEEVGTQSKVKGSMESNMTRRAKKWMKMVFYNNDQDTKTFFDKITKGVISATSLAYVGFNVFGNLNNYVFGRVSNAIETAGARYFSTKAMFRATSRFNSVGIPGLLKGMANNLDGDKKYKDGNGRDKYNAMVLYMRMLDSKQDMRETTYKSDHKSLMGAGKDMFTETSGGTIMQFLSVAFDKFHEVGYIIQDAGEYNVQTKIGHAIIESTTVKNSKTGETLSFYDAFTWDNKTKTLKLKDGFDTVIFYNSTTEHKIGPEGRFKTFADVKYELRNYIREVNKQVHGNYAHEDRMVMQSTAVGQLAAQFHKWVAPSIKARFRPAYFDENLGWMEGRYLSFWNFMKYSFQNIGRIGKLSSDYKAFNGENGQKRLQNVHRTLGEIGIIMTTVMLKIILSNMLNDDDDEDTIKLYKAGSDDSDSASMLRLRNALLYQLDRTHKELITYVPIPGAGGFQQMYQLFKSPIASTRTLGEMGQALEMTVGTGLSYAFMDDESFLESKYVYQRGKERKGKIKLGKEWGDALPILYTINRWKSYDNIKDFFIK